MNRYTLIIQTFCDECKEWKFIINAKERKEYVKDIIEQCKYMFTNPIDLMGYIRDEYGWEWEDFKPDIKIVMDY